MIEYQKIWDEKGYAKDGHTLELTLKYMNSLAKKHKIDLEIVAMAIREVIQEVVEGREYSLTHCPCGCGIDKSGTAINHAMRDRMFEIGNKVDTSAVKILEDRHNKAIKNYVNRKRWYRKFAISYKQEPPFLI